MIPANGSAAGACPPPKVPPPPEFEFKFKLLRFKELPVFGIEDEVVALPAAANGSFFEADPVKMGSSSQPPRFVLLDAEMPAAANGSVLVGALGLLKPMEANGSELRGGALFDFPNKSPRPPSPPPPLLANGSALVLANGSDYLLANGSAAGLEGPDPNGSTDAVVALPAPPPFIKANMSLSLLFDDEFPPKISAEGCAGLPPETPEKMSFTS